MTAHAQLLAPHVDQRLTGMPARGLVNFHVVPRHPKLKEFLVLAHELEMNDLAAGGFADQVGPGIPDRRQLFVQPPFHGAPRDRLNHPAGFAPEQELEHDIVVLRHWFSYTIYVTGVSGWTSPSCIIGSSR